MLSVVQIFERLKPDAPDSSRISIVPAPDSTRAVDRGGTSVDLRLGRWFRSFRQSQDRYYPLYHSDEKRQSTHRPMNTKEHFVPFGDEFVLHPNRFVLGVTLEWLSLPADLSGYVTGKSSLGRHGLVIETAAGIHPRFSGCLTLELANVGEVPLVLSPGMEVCQIFLHETVAADSGTVGTFSGRRKPSVELPKKDEIFDRLHGNAVDDSPGG
ncbi:dCTP deaminase [Roseibium sp.]|uniref:dCTP deaminase n=1 Tax=Roseibium sp. TaxID=1936156 RepID=UPI003298A80E